MRRLTRRITVTALWAAVVTSISLGLGSVLLAQGGGVSFDEVIRVFERNDCIRCHSGSNAAAGIDLGPTDAWENIVNERSEQARSMFLVAPGDPEESYLYLKLVNRHRQRGGRGSAMPIGRPRLSRGDLAIVVAWIEGGAER